MAVAYARGTVQAQTAESPMKFLSGLEGVLTDLGLLMGAVQPVTVKAGKAWLRFKGPRGRSLASKLGKLSKLQNTAAHPLLASIRSELGRLELPPGPVQAAESPIPDSSSATLDTEANTAVSDDPFTGKPDEDQKDGAGVYTSNEATDSTSDPIPSASGTDLEDCGGVSAASSRAEGLSTDVDIQPLAAKLVEGP